MKKPITTEPIKITVTKFNDFGDNFEARAEAGGRKMRATSTSTKEGAAHNLAVRHFFGGHTKAGGVGPEEFAAVRLRVVLLRSGSKFIRYEATLRA